MLINFNELYFFNTLSDFYDLIWKNNLKLFLTIVKFLSWKYLKLIIKN